MLSIRHIERIRQLSEDRLGLSAERYLERSGLKTAFIELADAAMKRPLFHSLAQAIFGTFGGGTRLLFYVAGVFVLSRK